MIDNESRSISILNKVIRNGCNTAVFKQNTDKGPAFRTIEAKGFTFERALASTGLLLVGIYTPGCPAGWILDDMNYVTK
jgi:hypothetical protein